MSTPVVRRPNTPKPPYYLLTGVVMGLVLGLVGSLFLLPAYADASPHALPEADRNAYRELIAAAYNIDNDLGRAKSRLELLKDKSPSVGLAAQSQQLFSQGGTEKAPQAKAMMQLSTLLAPPLTPEPTPTGTPGTPEITVTAVPNYLLTPSATLDPNSAVMTATPTNTITPTENLTPLATFTPWVTATPLPALGYPFELNDKSEVCDPQLSGLLQVEVVDQAKKPVPGVRITITWQGGEDFFYTGLHPNINLGYADFAMQNDVTYSLKVGDLSKAVDQLSAPACKGEDGKKYVGGLMLNFNQP